MKAYILILITVFGLSLIPTPNISTARTPETDFGEIAEVPNLPEIKPLDEGKIEDITENAQISTPVHTTRTTTTAPVSYNYTITKITSSIVEKPSNTDIYKTRKLVYAHNDPSLMLSALSLKKGDIFTLTENGVTKAYLVKETKVFSKTELQQLVPGTKHNLMRDVAYEAKNTSGVAHSIALMTCYERTRNAPHRFVVFADEI